MSDNCCCPSVIFGRGEGAPGPPGPEGPAGPAGPQGEPGESACVSTDSGNQLRVGQDGCLYVPPAVPPEPVLPVISLTNTTIVATEDGVFDPADYPGLQYIKVRAVGGGGGGAGVEEVVYGTTVAVGMSGSGGSYAESTFHAADLPGPITYTVGQGGAGLPQGAAQGDMAGDGGNTVFGPGETVLDAMLLALGGGGGGAIRDSTDLSQSNTARPFMAIRGAANPDHGTGLLASIGDITIPGGAGTTGLSLGAAVLGAGNTLVIGGAGGTTHMSGRTADDVTLHRGAQGWAQGTSTVDGTIRYGAGGTGRASAFDGIDENGYDGADGILFIEVVQLQVSVP